MFTQIAASATDKCGIRRKSGKGSYKYQAPPPKYSCHSRRDLHLYHSFLVAIHSELNPHHWLVPHVTRIHIALHSIRRLSTALSSVLKWTNHRKAIQKRLLATRRLEEVIKHTQSRLILHINIGGVAPRLYTFLCCRTGATAHMNPDHNPEKARINKWLRSNCKWNLQLSVKCSVSPDSGQIHP